jgi:hypothetical protein
MIRRAFWLSVGAAAGIAGYRRATAVSRSISVRLTGHLPGEPARPELAPGTARPLPARSALARPAPGRPALGRPALAQRPAQWSAARTAWRTSRAVWRAQRATLTRIRAAGLFARDVREGMDLYLNRQEGQPGPTLADTRSNRRPPARPQ